MRRHSLTPTHGISTASPARGITDRMQAFMVHGITLHGDTDGTTRGITADGPDGMTHGTMEDGTDGRTHGITEGGTDGMTHGIAIITTTDGMTLIIHTIRTIHRGRMYITAHATAQDSDRPLPDACLKAARQ